MPLNSFLRSMTRSKFRRARAALYNFESLEIRTLLSAVGDVDRDADFDANDSFLIHLVQLAGTDTQIDQSKGASPLSSAEIRLHVSQLIDAGDVDGDNDFDANDSFLIHLVQLSGSSQQVDQSKGPSQLSSNQIRANVKMLSEVGNDIPDIAAIENQTAIIGGQLVVSVSATDADTDDVLAFAVEPNERVPPGDIIIQSTGKRTALIRWTPTVQHVGLSVPFRVTVSDGNNGQDSEGYGVSVTAPNDMTIIGEGADFSTSVSQTVELGQSVGSRTVSFDLDAGFDTTDSGSTVEDIFQVHLQAPTTGEPLLEGRASGTAVFSLAGNVAEFQPGVVRYDGSRVEIDVTSLGNLTTADLVFQFINSDSDDGSKVAIGEVTSTVDGVGTASPTLNLSTSVVAPARPMDVAGLTETTDVRLSLSNVQFNETTGDYSAELIAHNDGPAIGRQLVVLFPGLPDDVMFSNASGTGSNGVPYVNLSAAVGSGGLAATASTQPVVIQLSNPNSTRFRLIPTVLSGGVNEAPTLPAIADITTVPGDYVEIALAAEDSDGDRLTYSLTSAEELPNGSLSADGTLRFQPAPSDLGTFDFTVRVSDGMETVSRSASITVEAGPITTTRFEGVILDTNEAAIPNLPIELRDLSGTVLAIATTGTDGTFTLESNAAIAADTIVVRGELFSGTDIYPFIAEKLPLVLGHDFYPGAKNVLPRPIYLPVLDVAGGTDIDPAQDTTVNQEIAAGEIASVFVEAGSLKMDDGNGNMVDFTGTLSITEVPASLTPAALPANLVPAAVVTIQPGEMVFTDPAELTLPNRGEDPPGTILDLWSINPQTGDFDNVGQGRVSANGQSIETISGGVNSSSWHFFSTPATAVNGQSSVSKDPNCGCGGGTGEAVAPFTSDVELHTGALRESHNLVAYQSLGQTRGLQLYYNSLHADPQPIVSFGYDNIPANDDRYVVAEVEVARGDFMYQLPGFEGGRGLDGGEHFWKLPAEGGSVTNALKLDLASVPTGAYDYIVRTGLFRTNNDGDFTGSSTDVVGKVYVTNLTESPYGAGWSLAGQQSIVENPDGSVLLLDGRGTRLVFAADPANVGHFLNPPADFSTLEKLSNGTYRRTMIDQTVYQFSTDHRLVTMTDRNNRITRWEYNGNGNLSKWIDPAGLETELSYSGNRVSTIVDPAGRITSLFYDDGGNLTQITDPDDTSREFGYDQHHRLTSEIDQRGLLEQARYGEDGRIRVATLKDGTQRQVVSAQSAALRPYQQTSHPDTAPVAPVIASAIASYADANGSVIETSLDQFGQVRTTTDTEGALLTVRRNAENQVLSTTDGRGLTTRFEYDQKGNLLSIDRPVLATDPVRLHSGETVSAFLHAADIDTFTISATTGNDLIINIQETGVDVQGWEARLYDPNGELVTVVAYDRSESIVVEEVTQSGDYTIIVRDSNPNGVSSYSITAVVIDEVIESDAVELVNGQSVTAFMDAGDIDTFTIAANAGTDLLISIQEVVGPVQNWAVRVYRPNGGLLLPESVYDRGESIVVTDLAESGVYTIVVRDTEPNGTGNYGITAAVVGNAAPVAGVELMSGQLVNATMDIGDIDVYTVSVGVAADLLINIHETDFGIPGWEARLYAPYGTLVESAVFDNGKSFVVDNSPLAGDYTLIVYASSPSGTSNYGMTATVVDDTPEFDDVKLVSGQLTTSSVTAGDIDTFSISVEAGDDLLVNIQETGGSVQDWEARLYSPDGTMVMLNYEAGGSFSVENATLAGDYIITIRDADANQSGSYNISAVVIDGEMETDVVELVGGQITNNSLSAGDIDSFKIAVQTGDGVQINIQETAGIVQGWEARLYDPNGGLVQTSTFTSAESLGVIGSVLSGDYTVTIRDSNANRTGNYQITALVNGQVASGETTVSERAPQQITEIETTLGLESVITANDMKLPLSTETVSIAPEQDTAIPVANGVTLRGTIDGLGESDLYSITLQTDADLIVGINNAPFDLEIQLRGPDNTVLGTQTDPSGFTLARTDLADAGLYSVIVRARNGTSTGDYTLTIQGIDRDSVNTGLPRRFTYDDVFNQITSMTDELGHQTIYEIDPANGNQLSMREVLGAVDNATNGETDDLITSFTYTNFGLIDRTTDPLGRVTDFGYDSFGRLETVTFAVGTADVASQTFEYDASGNQSTIVDENGNRTSFAYDNMNRLGQITEPDPDGPSGTLTALVTMFTYDERGNLRTTTDARGNLTTKEYDELGRVDRSIDANNKTTTFGYDGTGNLAWVTDPLGFTTRNSYDGRNRLVETTDPDGGVTRFDYDLDNNLASLTDPVGNKTEFEYDARNRLIREVDPLGAITQYGYDAADNLIRKSDRNGRITEFGYDDVDRLTTETWLAVDETTIENLISYGYDAASNLETVTDVFSTLTFAYDHRDRVKTVDNAGTPDTPNVVLAYEYDGVGNVKSVSDVIDGVARAITGYDYDALNRTITIQQSGTNVSDKLVDLVYNELGQFDEIIRYADLNRTALVATSDYEYDELNRLADLDHTNAANQRLAFYDFEYDASSRITKISDVDGMTDYSYDDRSQLTGADRDASDTRGDESYEYDGNGNRVSSHRHGDGYETGPANRLIADGSYTYEYDTEGNMIKRTEIATNDYREFEWDHRNRLIRVTDFASGGTATQVVEFAYDALDRRIARSVDADGAGTATASVLHSIYDREDVILDFVDPDGPGEASLAVLDERYLHGPGIDLVLAQEHQRTEWHLTDHLGTVRNIASSSGELLNHITYDSFGNTLQQSDPAFTTRYGYTGREMDLDIALTFHRSRYYSPDTGVFLSEDSVQFSGGDTNLRRFVGNSPINFVDPLGTTKKDPSGRARLETPVIYKIYNLLFPLGTEHEANPGFYPKVEHVLLRTDNGTPIEAQRNRSGDARYDTNCHGVTFADGLVRILGEEVPKILSGDNYRIVSAPRPGDVAIYYSDDKRYPVHSGTVTYVEGSRAAVGGLGGIERYQYSIPAEQVSIPFDQIYYYRKD